MFRSRRQRGGAAGRRREVAAVILLWIVALQYEASMIYTKASLNLSDQVRPPLMASVRIEHMGAEK
jgi:hypothetical protein